MFLAMRRVLLFSAFVMPLVGCGQPLPPLNFSVPSVGPSSSRINADLRNITVSAGRPDEATGPLPIDPGTLSVWKDALTEALDRMAIFSEGANRRVSLQVKVLKVDVPAAGISFTTTVDARYELIDRATGAILFSQTFSSSGTVPGDHAFLGMIRARESVNRAVQNNITLFLRSIESLRIDAPAFPSPRQ
jgi:hypothetical protein